MGHESTWTQRDAVTPTPADRALAAEIYGKYRQKPGADHIASQEALTFVASLLRVCEPKVVVELGAGIGTISDLVLSHPNQPSQFWAIEQNDWCQEQLQQNLAHHPGASWRLLRTLEDVKQAPIDRQVDLYIGDGGFYDPVEMRGAKLGTVFLAEGNRQRLRDLFASCLAVDQTIHWTEFGARRKWGWSRLGKLPIWGWFKTKGCWIGQVVPRA